MTAIEYKALTADCALTSSSYGDPLLRQTGLNPYQRYPERAQWTDHEVWTRADGTTFRVQADCMRWADSVSQGDWYLCVEVRFQYRITKGGEIREYSALGRCSEDAVHQLWNTWGPSFELVK